MKAPSFITGVVLFYCSVVSCLSHTVDGAFSAEFSLGQSPQRSLGDGWKQAPMMLVNKSHWSELSAFDRDEPEISGWHPRRFELDDLVPVGSIQPRRLEIVSHAGLGAQPVLAKLAASPSDVTSVAHENTMYRLLYGLDVTPLFLGHVIVGGRIVGFLTDYVRPRPGASDDDDYDNDDNDHVDDTLGSPPQKAPGKKVEACLAALRRMHTKRIAHGDAHGENCLVRGDGSAVLIDFELALETPAQSEFDRDLWIMTHTAGV